jgi:hypothetical protein
VLQGRLRFGEVRIGELIAYYEAADVKTSKPPSPSKRARSPNPKASKPASPKKLKKPDFARRSASASPIPPERSVIVIRRRVGEAPAASSYRPSSPNPLPSTSAIPPPSPSYHPVSPPSSPRLPLEQTRLFGENNQLRDQNKTLAGALEATQQEAAQAKERLIEAEGRAALSEEKRHKLVAGYRELKEKYQRLEEVCGDHERDSNKWRNLALGECSTVSVLFLF